MKSFTFQELISDILSSKQYFLQKYRKKEYFDIEFETHELDLLGEIYDVLGANNCFYLVNKLVSLPSFYYTLENKLLAHQNELISDYPDFPQDIVTKWKSNITLISKAYRSYYDDTKYKSNPIDLGILLDDVKQLSLELFSKKYSSSYYFDIPFNNLEKEFLRQLYTIFQQESELILSSGYSKDEFLRRISLCFSISDEGAKIELLKSPKLLEKWKFILFQLSKNYESFFLSQRTLSQKHLNFKDFFLDSRKKQEKNSLKKYSSYFNLPTTHGEDLPFLVEVFYEIRRNSFQLHNKKIEPQEFKILLENLLETFNQSHQRLEFSSVTSLFKAKWKTIILVLVESYDSYINSEEYIYEKKLNFKNGYISLYELKEFYEYFSKKGISFKSLLKNNELILEILFYFKRGRLSRFEFLLKKDLRTQILVCLMIYKNISNLLNLKDALTIINVELFGFSPDASSYEKGFLDKVFFYEGATKNTLHIYPNEYFNFIYEPLSVYWGEILKNISKRNLTNEELLLRSRVKHSRAKFHAMYALLLKTKGSDELPKELMWEISQLHLDSKKDYELLAMRLDTLSQHLQEYFEQNYASYYQGYAINLVKILDDIYGFFERKKIIY